MTPLVTIETISAENSYRHVRNHMSFLEQSAVPARSGRRHHGPAHRPTRLRALFRGARWTVRSV